MSSMKEKQHRHITLKEVAEHAGVSRATASLVLRGSQSISRATREKVLDSMRDLGYVYDRVAASLRSKSSSTVGLIIMELANPFYSELLVGIHQELDRLGQTVILGTTFDSPATQDRLLSTMLEHRVGGIILSAVSGSVGGSIERVRRLGVPVVLVGRRVGGVECDYVGVDNVLGGQMAADHLIRGGHRRIAFLGGPSRLTSSRERRQGYYNALLWAGIEVDDSLVTESSATRERGMESIERILRTDHPPTAIFCYNDVMAIGAMMKMREIGFTPGRDIAVVGFDDIPDAAICTPKLTTISSSIRLMGKEAATLLRSRIDGLSSEPQNIIVQPKLVVRESCSYSPSQTARLHRL